MMHHSQFLLLRSRQFLPLFIAQFFGALHDNVFKNALVVMLLFETTARAGPDHKILATLAAALFILPYILFSALGGQLADKCEKDRVIRYIKLAEIFIALLGIISLFTGILWLSLFTLFALGTHSALFSPSKYSILPQQLRRDDLIGGNALLNTGVFLAVLLGTILGTSLIHVSYGKFIVGAIMLGAAVAGYIAALYIPHAPSHAHEQRIGLNPGTDIRNTLVRTFTQSRDVILSILGISWFYFMGGMFLAQLPNFVHESLGGDEHILTLLLVLFSIGIAGGGLLNNRLLRGRIEAVYVPLAVLGLSLFTVDLYLASADVNGHLPLRVAFDIGLIAICGGLFVVPLNAIVQSRTSEADRSWVIAGNAIINAAFMVLSAVLSIALIACGLNVRELFLTFAIANAAVAAYICRLLPDYLFKSLLQIFFKLLYKVDVRGLENLQKAGKRAVVVGNHISLLDPPLLAAFLPGRPMFAVNSHVANWWWVKPFLRLVDFFPLDPGNPFSIKALIRKVEEDRHVVIFPEGRLTETGALMKVYDGPGMIADKADAMILPVRLDGVQHTPFARLKGKVPLHNFPKVTISILEPRSFKLDPGLTGQRRRDEAARQLYNLMEDMMFLTTDREQTLFQALLKAGHVNGNRAVIIEDIERRPMTFRDLLRRVQVLGRVFARHTVLGENVGLMLPNSCGAVASFFALQACGRVPAMLNYSTGLKSLQSACGTAQIKTIITSRRFIEVARLGEIIEQLSCQVRVIYLEDIQIEVTWRDKAAILFSSPADLHRRHRVKPTDPAVVLFTSGSEGEPKGVVLSHVNLMTNIVQLTARVDFNRQDVIFNCLPMFHSFGLTGGTLLPILSGVRTFLYPNPLHYRIVPEMVYSTNATIMFGTDTFLQGYGRMANAYDFYRMRYIFAGAERVKPETKRLYLDRFGVRIFEGYGATETAPVIAVNSPMQQQEGTVGRMLPGIEYRLEPVAGVETGGRLFVRGPNVMLGYYKFDRPGDLQPPEDGWHDTGDIVTVSDHGFVKILGRAKRFAKIAGEMVSLALVETIADTVWPGQQHAVAAIPDARKGERLVLVTTQDNADRGAILSYAAGQGITPLAVPTTIVHVDKMPALGSGKIDYVAIALLAGSADVKPEPDEGGEE